MFSSAIVFLYMVEFGYFFPSLAESGYMLRHADYFTSLKVCGFMFSLLNWILLFKLTRGGSNNRAKPVGLMLPTV